MRRNSEAYAGGQGYGFPAGGISCGKAFSALYRPFYDPYNFKIQHKNKQGELLNKGFSVSETAALIGYDDQFAFSKMYKKCTGVSPSKARPEKRSTTAKERH